MPSANQLMCVAWSAFLSACVLQGIVFSVVDPMELEWFGRPLPWSRQSIYTAAFFLFWASTALASLLAVMLSARQRPGA